MLRKPHSKYSHIIFPEGRKGKAPPLPPASSHHTYASVLAPQREGALAYAGILAPTIACRFNTWAFVYGAHLYIQGH